MSVHVTLPMYDLPEIRPATEAWCAAIAARAAGAVPDGTRLTQVCGYKLVDEDGHRYQPVATPAYAVPECQGTDYRSAVVVREDDPAVTLADLRGRVAAINNWDSHSGMNSLRALVAPLAQGQPFFAEVKLSGAHRDSAAMVRSGAADVAALDCVTYAHLRRHAPAEVAGLRTLTLTAPVPGLPYVTDAEASADTVAALRAALVEPPADLLIERIEVLPRDAYDRVAALIRLAADAGYPDLR